MIGDYSSKYIHAEQQSAAPFAKRCKRRDALLPGDVNVSVRKKMEISNYKELQAVAEKTSELLQEIHNYCANKNKTIAEVPESRVRFPRGFIRTAEYQRSRFPFISNADLKANIAYTLILSDTILWLAVRTDIFGTARDMLYKLFIFLVSSVIENTTKEYLKGHCGKNFCKRNGYLVDHGIISDDFREEIDWVWEIRNKMHIFQLDELEWENDYDVSTHVRCIGAFRGLLDVLIAKGNF